MSTVSEHAFPSYGTTAAQAEHNLRPPPSSWILFMVQVHQVSTVQFRELGDWLQQHVRTILPSATSSADHQTQAGAEDFRPEFTIDRVQDGHGPDSVGAGTLQHNLNTLFTFLTVGGNAPEPGACRTHHQSASLVRTFFFIVDSTAQQLSTALQCQSLCGDADMADSGTAMHTGAAWPSEMRFRI